MRSNGNLENKKDDCYREHFTVAMKIRSKMVISFEDLLPPLTLSHLEFEFRPFWIVLKMTRVTLFSSSLLDGVVFPKKNETPRKVTCNLEVTVK